MDTIQRALSISRSANFDCTVTIDQLVNVPLLKGSFKVKWKFLSPVTTVQMEAQLRAKHVATTISQRLSPSEEETLERSSASIRNNRSTNLASHSAVRSTDFAQPEKEKHLSHSSPQSMHFSSPRPSDSRILRSTPSSPELLKSLGTSVTATTNPIRLGNLITDQKFKNHLRKPSFEATPKLSFSLSGTDDINSSCSTSPKFATPLEQSFNPSLVFPLKAESSGSTPYVKLKNHSVLFRHAFHCPVSIQINKDGVLQPCILTMILKEEHITSQGRREVSKHGLVDIDLSQFAPIATVDSSLTGTERLGTKLQKSRIEKAKFLLNASKTNASLKVQIQMDFINGATVFKNPQVKDSGLEVLSKALTIVDDARSVRSHRNLSTGSPESSAVSSNSSYKTHGISGNNSSRTSKSPAYSHSTFAPEGQELNLQVADEVIDLLFSSTYTPSSGPLSHRAYGFSAKNQEKILQKNTTNIKSTLSLKPSELDRASSTRSSDSADEKSSRQSIRSFRPKFNLFNRSNSNLSALV
ncbi:hypothetical protein BY996DRAFT_4580435 [Phakopsora pachyrhizi]|uniref:C2 NT-type domain-containing protein n=1 Tax=Phakopsora pachyrhizi TaxID=170000 RepID=A0AAV0B0D3_PHAPC|nr:hypothetical protein BY996DRAFT_4580435 [Phakopsora pachyrhizi]CAH7674836.1 hypothetical protein PPACK8108_LOCUS9766 [Phakopsora pachyrhizi]